MTSNAFQMSNGMCVGGKLFCLLHKFSSVTNIAKGNKQMGSESIFSTASYFTQKIKVEGI